MIHDRAPFGSSVRLPSHINPPFRGRQWWNDNGTTVAMGAAQTNQLFAINFTRPATAVGGGVLLQRGAAFPEGHRGEVQWVYCAVSVDGNTNPSNSTNGITFTVYRNGTPVPGFFQMTMGTIGSVAAVPFPPGQGGRVLCPIHIEPGDRLDVQIRKTTTAVAATTRMEIGGWIYPVNVVGEAGSIRETEQDPGTGFPLG